MGRGDLRQPILGHNKRLLNSSLPMCVIEVEGISVLLFCVMVLKPMHAQFGPVLLWVGPSNTSHHTSPSVHQSWLHHMINDDSEN